MKEPIISKVETYVMWFDKNMKHTAMVSHVGEKAKEIYSTGRISLELTDQHAPDGSTDLQAIRFWPLPL